MKNQVLNSVIHQEMQKLSQDTDLHPKILELIETLSLPFLNLFPDFALAIHYLGKSLSLIVQVFERLRVIRLSQH